jgi:hypothetical protein
VVTARPPTETELSACDEPDFPIDLRRVPKTLLGHESPSWSQSSTTDFHTPGTADLESAARVHRAVCDGARCGRRTPTITSLLVGHFLTVGRRCERCRGPRWRYPRRAWPLVRCVGDCVAAAVACTDFWCAGRRRWGCCRRQTVLASVLAAVTALAALSAPLHVPGAGGYRSDRDCRGRVGRVW